MVKTFLSKTVLLQTIFWGVVFLLNVGPEWQKYGSLREVIEVAGTTTLLQGLVAVAALYYLVPRWLDRGLSLQFGLATVLLLFIAAEINIFVSYTYLEPTYPDTYGKYYQSLSHLSLMERLGFSSMIKYILFSKLPTLFFPAAVMLGVNYYHKQQTILALREQKQAAELDALKNQLNPHFIFNTLNNIYSLAIKQSKRTAEAVEKLSGILDYVLYRCRGQYVSLQEEVGMIEDYIALERLRFGDRLEIKFSSDITKATDVAPLLFLTLIENAFKHGTGQELKKASVNLKLTTTNQHIEFEVTNTKPTGQPQPESNASIGLANLKRQLGLLYPSTHRLDIVETDKQYTAKLTLGLV